MKRHKAKPDIWSMYDGRYDVFAHYRDPQSPGLGGLDELTSTEELTVEELDVIRSAGADRIVFWDETAGAFAGLTAGSGLTITGTTITADAGLLDGSGTANEIAYWVDSDTLGALAVATYPSLTELSYVKGVTSALQTQLGLKAPLASPTFTGTVTIPTPFTLGGVSVLPTGTELNFVDGVTSAIQTQIDSKQASDAGLTSLAGLTFASTSFVKMTGADTFTLDTNTYLTSVTAHNLLSSTHGDTVAASPALGDILHGDVTPAWTKLAGNVTTAKQYLSQTGTGAVSATPAWATIAVADVTGAAPLASPTFTGTVTLPKTLEIQDTSADHQYVLAVSELAADRIVTLPLLAGADEFVFKDHIQTLTNKTLTSPTLTTPALGTPASGVMTNVTGIPVGALANGTDGNLITWDASGVAAVVATGDATQVLTSNGVGTAPTFQAAAGGGANEFTYVLTPVGATLPNTNFAALNKVVGTNIVYHVLDFDTTTSEAAYWQIAIPPSVTPSTAKLHIHWTTAAGTAAQTVQWDVDWRPVANDEVIDATTTPTTTNDTVSDTFIAQGDLHVATLTLTTGSGIAANDLLLIKISRDVANDDMTGDVRFLKAIFEIT